MSTRRGWLWLVQNQFKFSDCREGATWREAAARWGYKLQGRFINEYRIHLRMNLCGRMSPPLSPRPGTDWLNRHDDCAFDDYTTLLFTAGTDAGGRRKGRRIEGSFHFLHRHSKDTRHVCDTHLRRMLLNRYYQMHSGGVALRNLAEPLLVSEFM